MQAPHALIEHLRAASSGLALILPNESYALHEFDAQCTIDKLPEWLEQIAEHLEDLPSRELWPEV
jgi:hypothetical protein